LYTEYGGLHYYMLIFDKDNVENCHTDTDNVVLPNALLTTLPIAALRIV
jgi:hypothetical protein